MRMTADTIKRKTKGAWIQIRFSGVFFLLLLVAVAAEQDGGIEIFQMRKQKFWVQSEIPTDFTGGTMAETKCRKERAAAGVRCNFFLRHKNRNQMARFIHFSNQNTVCRQLLKKFQILRGKIPKRVIQKPARRRTRLPVLRLPEILKQIFLPVAAHQIARKLLLHFTERFHHPLRKRPIRHKIPQSDDTINLLTAKKRHHFRKRIIIPMKITDYC